MNILHKLGLYTKAEIDELIAKTAALTESVDGVIEEAKINKECYKIAIHLYNASNEFEHAVKVISDYCDRIGNCTECDFGKNECRFAHEPPCDWRIER